MSKIGAMWKALTDEEKGTWKTKADVYNASAVGTTITLKTKAAKSLGISRRNLIRKVQAYGLDRRRNR